MKILKLYDISYINNSLREEISLLLDPGSKP